MEESKDIEPTLEDDLFEYVEDLFFFRRRIRVPSKEMKTNFVKRLLQIVENHKEKKNGNGN